jgi:hypothetical protein
LLHREDFITKLSLDVGTAAELEQCEGHCVRGCFLKIKEDLNHLNVVHGTEEHSYMTSLHDSSGTGKNQQPNSEDGGI